MRASFDGLIYDPIKGQIDRIDIEHRRTGAALEANPTITLSVFRTHTQLAFSCDMSNSWLLMALLCTDAL